MSTTLPPSTPSIAFDTFAELLESIGDVPLSRIRANPAPGTATEEDVLAIHANEDRLYELVDGVLVEKTMGFYEAILATRIAHLIKQRPRRTGSRRRCWLRRNDSLSSRGSHSGCFVRGLDKPARFQSAP